MVPEQGSVLPAGWVAALSVGFYPLAFGTARHLCGMPEDTGHIFHIFGHEAKCLY